MRRFITLLVLVALAGGGVGFWYWRAHASQGSTYRTAAVERGYLEAVIGATGTLEPEEVIDVGAQVAGRIERFGLDPSGTTGTDAVLASASTVGLPAAPLGKGPLLTPFALCPTSASTKTIDYGSRVEKGTILAQLDQSLYLAQRNSAKANLEKTKADLLQKQAVLVAAERDWLRSQDLAIRKALATADYDTSRAGYETARANVEVSKAAIAQAAADLQTAETNLDYTTIRSPVKGVVIDRRVNVGQTVVASLQAPSLFLLAKDLSKLQVWASVNEADIGQIKIGQPVRFTVDALPGKVFYGKVLRQGDYQTRLNASMTQNVVTYTVVISTDNSKGELLPYLTANVQFIANEKSDALLVPNAALRWRPQVSLVAPDIRDAYARSLRQKQNQKAAAAQQGGAPAPAPAAEKERHDRGMVWVADGGFVRPVRVQIGLSDGTSTEILGGDLHEGMHVVTGEARQDNGDHDANPFAPKLFGGKKQQ
jgi:HlyD family secretion protein